jgi:hypothetical protein
VSAPPTPRGGEGLAKAADVTPVIGYNAGATEDPMPALLALLACASDYNLKNGPVDVNPGDVTACPFTQVEDTPFYRYDCNPVFPAQGNPDAAWASDVVDVTFAVTEVMEHPFYQAWYVGANESSDGYSGIGYAVSPDGTGWTTHPQNPVFQETAANAWDGDTMAGLQVVWDATRAAYVMVYQGINFGRNTWGMGVATSPDGVTWEKQAGNPVVDFTTQLTDLHWCWPLGLTASGDGNYTGYIAGQPIYDIWDPEYYEGRQTCDVYRVQSTGLGTWTVEPTPVFGAAANGAWDDTGFTSIAIEELDGVTYMFYVGFGDWEQHTGYVSASGTFLGYATLEGGSWVRQGRVPLNMTTDGDVRAVAARRVGTRIHLWVTDAYPGEDAAADPQAGVGYFLFDPNATTAAE